MSSMEECRVSRLRTIMDCSLSTAWWDGRRGGTVIGRRQWDSGKQGKLADMTV